MVNLVNMLVQDTGVECLVCYMKDSQNQILREERKNDIPTKWKKSSKKKKKKI